MEQSEKNAIHWFENRTAVLATMHRKEQAIAPILEELGIQTIVPENFNTDAFGTFTREIPRSGSQLEAARLKALKAMELTGSDLAIASEGSFAPHPAFPIVPCDRELIVLIDARHDLEIVGEVLSTDTNFNHQSVKDFDQAYEFAVKAGFPEHGLIVRINETEIIKGINTLQQFQAAVRQGLARSSKIQIETDMRAMHNPKRMKVIEQAARNLVQNIRQLCPACSMPGFTFVEPKLGLPCGWCGLPTENILAHIHQCKKCGFQQEKLYPNGIQTAEPMYCSYCNP